MAGTVVFTEKVSGGIKSIKAAWTASAGGAADGTTAKHYSGKVELLTTIPDGVAVPIDNYDITALDEYGVDVLAGAGANRDTANTEQVLSASLGGVVGDKIAFHVANAGNGGKGVVYLLVR